MAGRESSADKARRLLAEGRLRVLRVGDADAPGLIVAECRGDSGEVYALGYDPRNKQWRCVCAELRGKCSHIQALQLVTAIERTS